MNSKKDFLFKYNYYFKEKPDFFYEAIINSVFDIVNFYNSVCKDDMFSVEILGDISGFKEKKDKYTIQEIIFNRLYSNINKVHLEKYNNQKCKNNTIAYYDCFNKEIFIDITKDKENTVKVLKNLTAEQQNDADLVDKIKRFSIVHELLHAISDDITANFIYNKKQKLNEIITEDITINVLNLRNLNLLKTIRCNDDLIYLINTNSRSGYFWGNGIAFLLSSIPNFNVIKGYVVNSINSQIAYDNYVKDFSQSLNKYKSKNGKSIYFEGLVNTVEKIYKMLKTSEEKEKAFTKIINLQKDLLIEYNRNVMGQLSLKSLQSLTKQEISDAKQEVEHLKHQLVLILGNNKCKVCDINKELNGTSFQIKELINNNFLKPTPNLLVMIEIQECVERIEKSIYVKKNLNKSKSIKKNMVNDDLHK